MFALLSVPLAVALVVLVGLLFVLKLSHAVVYIPNDRVGIVERLWGGPSLTQGLIARNGEVGFQPQLLRGGFHFFFPFQYRVHRADLVTIPQGQIGYVFARDGAQLAPGQTLGHSIPSFEDVAGFLSHGGQKGPQRSILREGTYAIHLSQFAVITAAGVQALFLSQEEQATIEKMGQVIGQRNGFTPVVIGAGAGLEGKNGAQADVLGVVTIHDGPALPADEIVAPSVGQDRTNTATFHNSFQDIEAFFRAGGYRGRQHQVLIEGTFYLNRLFATVELIEKTVVPVGSVGVVVSYIGAKGEDRSGESYSHGELVDRGCRGVWSEALTPGKYAFNTYAGRVMPVPTTNFILKWSEAETSQHNFDANLSEVDLITKDAFEPRLPLSVVVHIDPRKAPLVVQRFGDINRLVDQTLDPMVSAYFKNIGQTKTLIELLQERADIQSHASEEMKTRFADYNLELQEVLIGTPKGARDATGQPTASGARIDTILNQLRDRQVAKEQIETFRLQEESAVQERTLREARAKTEIQGDVTKSLIAVEIKTNQGAADVAAAERQAQVVRINAQAEQTRLEAEGQGQASKIKAIGEAEAEATSKKVAALHGPGSHLQVLASVAPLFADAIKTGQVALVPQVSVGGGADGASNLLGLIAAQVGNMLAHTSGTGADAAKIVPTGALDAPQEARPPAA